MKCPNCDLKIKPIPVRLSTVDGGIKYVECPECGYRWEEI